jgi:Flp pilus assembly pilin Flp
MLSIVVSWIKMYLPKSEQGQDLIEYAMLGGLIALAIIGVSVAAFSGALTSLIDGIGTCIDFDASTNCQPF